MLTVSDWLKHFKSAISETMMLTIEGKEFKPNNSNGISASFLTKHMSTAFKDKHALFVSMYSYRIQLPPLLMKTPDKR